MTFISTKDYGTEVSLGNIPGVSAFKKFGKTDNVDSGVSTVIWDGANGGTVDYTAPTAARIHSVVSTSAADDITGTGLRTVRIFGLDGSNNLIQEDLDLDGTVAVNTVNSYTFIYRMQGVVAGSDEVNQGDITATAATDGTISAIISADKGQTLMAIYRVPAGKKLLVTGYYSTLGRNTPSSARCNVELIEIINSTTAPTLNIKHSAGLFVDAGQTDVVFKNPYVFEALSTIYVRAVDCTDNNTEVSAWFEGELRDA